MCHRLFGGDMKKIIICFGLLFGSAVAWADNIPNQFLGKWGIDGNCYNYALFESEAFTTDNDYGMASVKSVEKIGEGYLLKGVETDEGIESQSELLVSIGDNGVLDLKGKHHSIEYNAQMKRCDREEEIQPEIYNPPQSRWLLIKSNKDGQMFVDTQTISNGSAWVKIESNKPIKISKRGGKVLFSNYQFSCGSNIGGVVEFIVYTDSGKEIDRFETPQNYFKPFRHESLEEMLYIASCKR